MADERRRLPNGHDGLPYNEAKIHSDRKRAFLEAYLRVWTDDVGRTTGPRPSLDIFDLYAASGMVIEREHKSRIWPGTSILGARALNAYDTSLPCHLVLNSWDPNEATRLAQLEAIKTRIGREYRTDATRRVAFFSEELPKGLDKIMSYHPERARYPSLWVLDPYKATIVPWTMIESIGNRVGSFKTKSGRLRHKRPELFINFMTSTLQRIVHDVDAVCSVLGWSPREWRAYSKAIEDEGGNVKNALVTAYHHNLHQLYGRHPHVVPVPGKKGNIVSYMFLVVEHDAAWHSIRTKTIPAYADWVIEKHEPREAEILLLDRIRDLKAKGQTQLEDHDTEA